MTKGYGRIIKSISSASSNLAEQKIVLRKTTHENKKTTGNDDIRQSSQKVIQKFRKLTTKFTSSKQEEPKTNNTLNTLSKDILVTQPSISTSNEEPKLKGILRNSNQNLSRYDSIDKLDNKSYSEVCLTTNNTNISNDDNKAHATLNSSKTNKRVTFSDKTSKKKYKPSKRVLNALKLSNLKKKNLEKTQRKDSLDLPTMKFRWINATNSALTFRQIDYSDSSEDDFSDNDD